LTEAIRLVSSKLPSYSGVNWCQHAQEACTKSKKIVIFGGFAKFVRDQAELANDPRHFLTECFKGRKKEVRQNKGDSSSSASTFVISSMQPPNNFVPPSKPSADQTDQTSSLCNSQHTLVKCNKSLEKSIDDRSKFL